MNGLKNRFKRASFPGRHRHPPSSATHVEATLQPWMRLACILAAGTGTIAGTYLCLRSNSNLRTVPWIPEFIAQWSDRHGEIRNFPAFAVLAVPFLILARTPGVRRWTMAGLAAFVAITELAQYFIPTRWCQWQDIACGWAGLLAAWGLFFLLEICWGAPDRRLSANASELSRCAAKE